jgi:ribosomal protein S18 acetylase RimI-like enzyme
LRTARLAALAEAPYAFSSTISREQAFTDDTWRSRIRTGAIYAAWSADAIVGLATGRLSDNNPGWELVGMWVSPDWRATGVADQLVHAVCQHVRRAGADDVCLWVVETNSRAISFYQRLGFARTGARQLVRDDEPDRFEVELARDLA